MKNYIFALGTLSVVVLFIIIKFGFWSVNEVSIDKLQVTEGVTYLRKTLRSGNNIVHIDLFKVDTSKAAIGITNPKVVGSIDARRYDAYSIEEYATRGPYVVVQSGGFLSSWSPPSALGYVKVKGIEYNPVHDSWLTNGVFCTNCRKFEIKKFTSSESFSGWTSCLQAGPLIAEGGKIVLNTARHTWYVTGEKHRQSFMCKASDGRLIMGLAEDVSLADFSRSLIASEEDGGIGCIDAVLLTSKGIAGIYSSNPDIPQVGSVDVPLPNAIVVHAP